MEWFPLAKEDALAQKLLWIDPDQREYKPATAELPDHIKDTPETILQEIMKCDFCGRNYQFIAKELSFHQRFNLALARDCPLCRDFARFKQLNPIAIFDRTCAKCNKDIQTSYAPERPELSYCEECFQNEAM